MPDKNRPLQNISDDLLFIAMPFPAKTNTDAIIASATEIIKTGGISSLSMRTLAAHLGVRASSLYRHFPDRSTIEKNLAMHAARQLLDCMQHAVQGLSGERAVFAAARAYLDFATSETAFYDLMMQSGVISQRPESIKELWNFFLRVISDTTHFNEDAAGATALWSFLHGFTVLARAGQAGEMSSKQAFARGTQALVRGLSVAEADAAHSAS